MAPARPARDVIARFGCHPHRNEILGRASTPEELEYLRTETPQHLGDHVHLLYLLLGAGPVISQPYLAAVTTKRSTSGGYSPAVSISR